MFGKLLITSIKCDILLLQKTCRGGSDMYQTVVSNNDGSEKISAYDFCDVCGKALERSELYDDRFHASLCRECLCLLHKL